MQTNADENVTVAKGNSQSRPSVEPRPFPETGANDDDGYESEGSQGMPKVVLVDDISKDVLPVIEPVIVADEEWDE